MKQKIVMKVAMHCDKCRSMALKIAARTPGVSSIALEGEEKDILVVIGEDVDSVCLAKFLRKKLKQASILSVEQVKEDKEDKEKDDNKKKEEEFVYYHPPCPPYYTHLVYEDPWPYHNYNSLCTIM